MREEQAGIELQMMAMLISTELALWLAHNLQRVGRNFLRCGDKSTLVPVDIRTVGELVTIVKTNTAGNDRTRRQCNVSAIIAEESRKLKWTYRNPVPKMVRTPNFLFKGICRPNTVGKGSMNMKRSRAILQLP